MDPKMPWYQSAIVRQQIVQIVVALTALFGVNLGGFDVDKELASIFAGIAGIVGVWTLLTRLFKPAPNLTATAEKKEIQLVADKTIPPSPTGPQKGFFRPSLVVCLALACAGLALALLPGCAVNPHKTATNLEQQGDAAYGELVILKEQGAKVLEDASVADALKRPVAEAIVAAKPVTDGLQDSLILYSRVKADMTGGTGTSAQLATVDRELSGWLAQAQPIITRLTAALAGVKK